MVLSDGDNRSMRTLVGAIDAPAPVWRTPADVPAEGQLHITAFFRQAQRLRTLPELLTDVRANGLTVSLDTSLDPAGSFEGRATVLPHVDCLLPNDDELLGIVRALTGSATADREVAEGALPA